MTFVPCFLPEYCFLPVDQINSNSSRFPLTKHCFKKKEKKWRKEEKREGKGKEGKGQVEEEGRGKKKKSELPSIPVFGQIILLKPLIPNTMYRSTATGTVPTLHFFT